MEPPENKTEISYHDHVTTSAGKQLTVTPWHTNFLSGINCFHAGFPPVLHIEHPKSIEDTALVPKRHAQ